MWFHRDPGVRYMIDRRYYTTDFIAIGCKYLDTPRVRADLLVRVDVGEDDRYRHRTVSSSLGKRSRLFAKGIGTICNRQFLLLVNRPGLSRKTEAIRHLRSPNTLWSLMDNSYIWGISLENSEIRKNEKSQIARRKNSELCEFSEKTGTFADLCRASHGLYFA